MPNGIEIFLFGNNYDIILCKKGVDYNSRSWWKAQTNTRRAWLVTWWICEIVRYLPCNNMEIWARKKKTANWFYDSSCTILRGKYWLAGRNIRCEKTSIKSISPEISPSSSRLQCPKYSRKSITNYWLVYNKLV